MNQNDKGLLLVDLCSRYPYGIIVRLDDKNVCVEEIKFSKGDYFFTLSGDKTYVGVLVDRIKPYLRPISSMTYDEREEYKKTFDTYENKMGVKLTCLSYSSTDWLTAHHFDFRGLIDKGLALEALPDMY